LNFHQEDQSKNKYKKAESEMKVIGIFVHTKTVDINDSIFLAVVDAIYVH